MKYKCKKDNYLKKKKDINNTITVCNTCDDNYYEFISMFCFITNKKKTILLARGD